jgi:hypothetical protein
MQRRAFALAFGCAPGAIAIACSTFSSNGDTPPGGDAASDAPIVDPAPPPPAPDAPTDGDGPFDAGPNLLTNGDFENGCAGWAVNLLGTMAVGDPLARHGSESCRVCRVSLDGGYEFVNYATLTSVPPGTYVFEAWVRSAPDGGPPPSSIQSRVSVLDKKGMSLKDGPTSPGITVTDVWSMTSALVTFSGDGGAQLAVLLLVTGGQCWLVDDARLYVQ